jgi:hypothetical protein
MSKAEVATIIGTRGTLQKLPAGYQWECPAGHMWHPPEQPKAPLACPVCGQLGHPDLERWTLYRSSPQEWVAVFIAMTFDEKGKLKGWHVGDS